MRQRTIVGLAVLASLVGCGLSVGQTPPIRRSTVATVPPRASYVARSGMSKTEDSGKPESGELLGASFADCIEASEGITSMMQACIETEYEIHEKRLRAAYDALIKASDGPIRRKIELAQTQWLANDEKECPWNGKSEGQAQRLDANFCSLQRVAKRALELERELESRE